MASPESYGQVKRKGMLFGDDNWATVEDEEPAYKNKRGIEMKRYLIIPHDHTIKQYPELQRQGALSYKGIALWKEYPTYWIDDRNPSRTNAIVRVACGFDGRETLQTKWRKQYTDEIKMLREELENVNLSNMHLSEENKKLLTEKKEAMKEFIELANLNQANRRPYDYNEDERRPGE